MCCEFCGRDTRSKGGVCQKCLGGKVRFAGKEMQDRKQLNPRVWSNSAIDFVEINESCRDEAKLNYHGNLFRDDV